MVELWQMHATFMTIGFGLLVFGIIIANRFRDKSWWLKVHRILGFTGTIFAITGLTLAILSVSYGGRDHLTVIHHYVGVTTIIFLVITPILGFAQFKVGNRGRMAKVHRWSGRLTLLLMLITIIMGLRYAAEFS